MSAPPSPTSPRRTLSRRRWRGTWSTGSAFLLPLKEVVLSPQVHPVNRGFNSIVEAAVHGTRYLWNRDPELRRLIDHHRSVVLRCGGPRELEALGLLDGFLGIPKGPAEEKGPA